MSASKLLREMIGVNVLLMFLIYHFKNKPFLYEFYLYKSMMNPANLIVDILDLLKNIKI
jgi:hypothetical protein